ncbi:hypothetical protein BGZ83_000965 [Gryganskiella cystojenkinii]|nr:hypothetical protein BGZ83_000965 [Gryganskiella cystojenkinii]
MWSRRQKNAVAKQKSPPSLSSDIHRRPNPLQIAEILGRILSFLDQDTLKYAVARVCRLWFQVAAGLFDRHLYLDHNDLKSWTGFKNRIHLADKLTFGRTIGPWHEILSEKESEKWDSMMGFAVRTLAVIRENYETTKAGSPKEGDNRICKTSGLKFRTLSLNLEHWWAEQEQIVIQFNPLGLRELNLDIPFESAPVQLETLLDLLPNLLRLSISARKWNRYWRINDQYHHTWVFPPQDNNNSNLVTVHPLRHLRLCNIPVSPSWLQYFLPRLTQLKELYLLDVKNTPATSIPQNTFNDEVARERFWQSLSEHCPKMETIHLNCQDYTQCSSCEIPVEQFPDLCSLGLDGRPRAATTITWKGLSRVENRLTSLELLGTDIYLSFEDHQDPTFERDRTLFQFLASSPCLLHLKTGLLQITWRALWDPTIFLENEQMSTTTTATGATWACRGLKTLSMRVSKEVEGYNARCSLRASVLGYLGRVCPRLQELSLWVGFQIWEPKDGLCLLIRLRELRQLELGTGHLHTFDKRAFQERNFVWMQKSTPSPLPPPLAPSSLSSFIKSSLRSRFRLGGSSRSKTKGDHQSRLKEQIDREHDLQYCIDLIWNASTSSSTVNWTGPYTANRSEPWQASQSKRAHMQEQQERNRYRSDFERQLLVDGLEDFTFFGSNLDIEACLRAQLFRIRHLDDGAVTEEREMDEPWKKLECLMFTHTYESNRRDRVLEKYMEQGCRMLQRLRPDIDVQCRFIDFS